MDHDPQLPFWSPAVSRSCLPLHRTVARKLPPQDLAHPWLLWLPPVIMHSSGIIGCSIKKPTILEYPIYGNPHIRSSDAKLHPSEIYVQDIPRSGIWIINHGFPFFGIVMQWLSMMILVRNDFDGTYIYNMWLIFEQEKMDSRENRTLQGKEIVWNSQRSWDEQTTENRPINPGNALKTAVVRPGDWWPKLRTSRHWIVNVTRISPSKKCTVSLSGLRHGLEITSQTALDDGLDQWRVNSHTDRLIDGLSTLVCPIPGDDDPSNGSKTTPRASVTMVHH